MDKKEGFIMKAKEFGLTKNDIIEMSDKYMLNIGYQQETAMKK